VQARRSLDMQIEWDAMRREQLRAEGKGNGTEEMEAWGMSGMHAAVQYAVGGAESQQVLHV